MCFLYIHMVNQKKLLFGKKIKNSSPLAHPSVSVSVILIISAGFLLQWMDGL